MIHDGPPPTSPRKHDALPVTDRVMICGTAQWEEGILGYVRAGGCTKVCGACCTSLWLPLKTTLEGDALEDWVHWLELHGLWVFRFHGELYASIPLPCSALNEQRECSIHDQPSYPQMCRQYPKHPVEILGLEGICTYRFLAIEGE